MGRDWASTIFHAGLFLIVLALAVVASVIGIGSAIALFVAFHPVHFVISPVALGIALVLWSIVPEIFWEVIDG